jgi:carbon storage regulator
VLVLTRRPGEAIIVGDDVELVVLEVRGETVKIGVKAPRSVKVWRKELLEAIVSENLAAAGAVVPGSVGELLKEKREER